MAPSRGAGKELNVPWKLPIGVRHAPAITTSRIMTLKSSRRMGKDKEKGRRKKEKMSSKTEEGKRPFASFLLPSSLYLLPCVS
jgi:hypothetical protein